MRGNLVVNKVWFTTSSQVTLDSAVKIAEDNSRHVSLTVETKRVGRFLPRTEATVTFKAHTPRGNEICEDIARQVGQL